MADYTIMLVDDEPNILSTLKRLLHNEHAYLITANNAQEALERLQSMPVHLLITDNIMPGMSGVELIKKVKEMSPDTIRIVLSGQSDIDAVLKAVNEGEAYRFILKPWNDLELKITVNIALAQYKLTADNQALMAELKEKKRLLESIKARHPEWVAESMAADVCSAG